MKYLKCGLFLIGLATFVAPCGCSSDQDSEPRDSSSSAEPAGGDYEASGAEPPAGEDHEASSAESAGEDHEAASSSEMIGGDYEAGGFSKERVYFVTNRDRNANSEDPNEYFVSELSSLRFGYCDVSIPYKRERGTLPEPGWFEWKEDPKKHVVLLTIEVNDRETTQSAIAERVEASAEKEVLLFIHGYQNTFRDAARRTAQLAFDLNFDGPAVFFSWPAGHVNYLADLRRAEDSIDECVEFVRMASGKCGAKRVHVIAHSMGNFVLTKALEKLATSPEGRADLKSLHHIALAAPDINAETFRRKIAPAISGLANRFTVYASTGDLAMDVSREVNQWEPLGDVSDESVKAGALSYVDFIDASEIAGDSWFSVGHAYYGDMPELIRDVRDLFRDVPTSSRRLTQSGTIYLLRP